MSPDLAKFYMLQQKLFKKKKSQCFLHKQQQLKQISDKFEMTGAKMFSESNQTVLNSESSLND